MVRLTAGFEDVCESFISGLAEIFLSQYYFFCSSEMMMIGNVLLIVLLDEALEEISFMEKQL